MITILNRILPRDISCLIYDFVVKSHINNIMVGKLYLIELMMEKFIRIHKSDNFYTLNFDNDHNNINRLITNIYNNFVFKKVYKFDPRFLNLLEKYIECLTYHNSYQKVSIKNHIFARNLN